MTEATGPEAPDLERKRVWKTPPGVALCAEGDIADPGARGFVLQIGEAFFHGFVVRKGEAVFGYACLLDMVVRGREERVFRKAYDTFCPVGPWIVTADEVGDVQNLDMWLDLNGKRMQTGNTKTMIFNVAQLISYVSEYITLYPGDVIATGTPVGVGIGFTPPKYLKSGDVVRVEIDGIGVLENPVT